MTNSKLPWNLLGTVTFFKMDFSPSYTLWSNYHIFTLTYQRVRLPWNWLNTSMLMSQESIIFVHSLTYGWLTMIMATGWTPLIWWHNKVSICTQDESATYKEITTKDSLRRVITRPRWQHSDWQALQCDDGTWTSSLTRRGSGHVATHRGRGYNKMSSLHTGDTAAGWVKNNAC